MRSPKSPIDDAWLDHALANTEAVLRDHAHAERKAAATAMGLVVQYADIPELVEAMTSLAIEELEHFQEVYAIMRRRGMVLGPDPGDPYAKALMGKVRGTREVRLVDRLLIGALIEATPTAAGIEAHAGIVRDKTRHPRFRPGLDHFEGE